MAPEPTVVETRTGTDQYLATEFLLTTYSDGVKHLAVRPIGQSTWSPPITLEVKA